MAKITDMFWQASLQEIKQGYVYLEHNDEFVCLLCGKSFANGLIYPEEGRLYEARKYIQIHLEQCHRSTFYYLLNLDKKLTGLTDHQKAILELFYEGHNDNEVARELGTGSTSTIRNHRFTLREKQKQAKVFLAIMELLGERMSGRNTFADSSLTQQFHDKAAITEQESIKILSAYFKQGLGGPLASYPLREKKRLVVLEHLSKNFDPGRNYTEKEVTAILSQFYEDHVLLRRHLIEYGFMDRTPDGKSCWLKAERNITEKELHHMDERKALKLAYKQFTPSMGVYQIKNNVNGKILIGSSMNLAGSNNSHRYKLEFYSKHNKSLQEDLSMHGADAFSFEVLETVNPDKVSKENWRDAVSALEEKWLNKLQPYGEKGYNRPPKVPKL